MRYPARSKTKTTEHVFGLEKWDKLIDKDQETKARRTAFDRAREKAGKIYGF